MNPLDATHDIIELLGRFEGVSVLGHYQTSAYMHIRLNVESFSSLYYLTYVSEGANTRLDSYTNSKDAMTIQNSPANALEHRFEIVSHGRDEAPFENLLVFGVWIV